MQIFATSLQNAAYFRRSLMKSYSRIKQFGAFGLILLFSLQAGLGLWLHTTLHLHPAKATVHAEGASVSQQSVAPASCSCLDFLSTTFTHTGFSIAPVPPQLFFTKQVSVNAVHVPGARQIFRPLRAPPVFVY
jgi:hypothetical protein